MAFKIDLDICGESVECEAEIILTGDADEYMGCEIVSLVMVLEHCESDIIGITDSDEINKLIIDAYLESVGE